MSLSSFCQIRFHCYVVARCFIPNYRELIDCLRQFLQVLLTKALALLLLLLLALLARMVHSL